jgi:KipI family sensor histidine kinase inhibitor
MVGRGDDPLGGVAIEALGDSALLIRGLDQDRLIAIADALVDVARAATPLEDVVPGDGTILLRFDGTVGGEIAARQALAVAAASAATSGAGREHLIPVRYGGADGPDLDEVAAMIGLAPDAVVAAHAAATHVVAFLGFAPGFPYLRGLPPGLVVPRLAVPRTATPPGSVAIAEHYTGIYPARLPGGWRVIGRTDVPLFDPTADPPARLRPGDRVRFDAI